MLLLQIGALAGQVGSEGSECRRRAEGIRGSELDAIGCEPNRTIASRLGMSTSNRWP
jgi:hypothetical protein